MPISGLDHAETVELLERAGERAADENTIALASSLLAETEGNPFFIGEVLRNLLWSPEGRSDVQRRLDEHGVGFGARYSRWASVTYSTSGWTVSESGATEILESRTPSWVVSSRSELCTKAADSDEGLVVDTIETALASRLVEEAGVDRFRFLDVLVRQTLYERLSTSRRLRLHRRIAHHLEDEDRGVDRRTGVPLRRSRSTRRSTARGVLDAARRAMSQCNGSRSTKPSSSSDVPSTPRNSSINEIRRAEASSS